MLVIFDCDGVLVDSEPLAAQVFSEALAPLGIMMSADECLQQFHGHSLAYCVAWLEITYGRALPKNFIYHLEQATFETFSHQLRPVRGIRDVLKRLNRAHIPYCVASNGSHAKIRNSLEVTGLLPFFSNRRFSVEDVACGKPAPDIFQYAAESMGVPTLFTTVVEDSLAGLEAAQAAGMRALIYMPRHDVEISVWEIDVHATGFRKMEDLPGLLGLI